MPRLQDGEDHFIGIESLFEVKMLESPGQS